MSAHPMDTKTKIVRKKDIHATSGGSYKRLAPKFLYN